MPLMPMWKKLKAIAHTLPYDITFVKDNQRGKPPTAEPMGSNSLRLPWLPMAAKARNGCAMECARWPERCLTATMYKTLPEVRRTC